MNHTNLGQRLASLESELKGELCADDNSLLMYATDASVYRERPLAVARPRDKDDLLTLIRFARETGIPLIPRAAGTSLSGQVVGSGLVVDISKYMTAILELNVEERWVRVEPGVVPDELNKYLEPHGLFFAPETSTSNRCMIGGMVGNNSCGAHSLLYGSTRDHLLELSTFLSDAENPQDEVTFTALSDEAFNNKCNAGGREGEVYRTIREILSNPANRENIRKEYPHPEIKRRNTGYALDLLLETSPFVPGGAAFNMCKLLAGSEGTLAFTTSIKLNLVPLPPKEKALVCIHCHTLEEAFHGNLVALRFKPGSVELIDRIIIECTRDNIEQRKNRFFIEGEPEAILVVEFARDSADEIRHAAHDMEQAMRAAGYGHHFPLITGPGISKVWALRKAGLGLLSNVPGDAKPVTVVEDTAVRPADLPEYMREFREILEGYGKECVFYAHIATGELHLKPVLNLRDPSDLRLFRQIGTDIARLVKKYRGSLSGEHGDGRLRGEFIPFMIGEHNYALLKQIKRAWDPGNIFNPGKITHAPPMDTSLRFKVGERVREIPTWFDFSHSNGILRAVEKCNGSGDCRKTSLIGGTMCPSFQATRDEKSTTRARANILREFLTNSPKSNPFDHKELADILDLCLSCKGCKAECPSNVDMARFKAEFLQHYYDANGIPLRARLIAGITFINSFGSLWPGLFNALTSANGLSLWIKRRMGIAPERSIPGLYKFTLRSWVRNHREVERLEGRGKVYLFADEFTNFNDVATGMKAVQLLQKLGYEVEVPEHVESGRAYMSTGLLKQAKKLAEKNIRLLSGKITAATPLLGIEPSAILSFRDEYPDLVGHDLREQACALAPHCLMIDEFISMEFEKGKISSDLFTHEGREILLHGHCHQKALASVAATKKMLSIPSQYKVSEIPSGCCGMAGSFGYEAEHYEVSMKVGELVLFPAVRAVAPGTVIAAPGTSCRHQILDGTGRRAYHPLEILYDALLK